MIDGQLAGGKTHGPEFNTLATGIGEIKSDVIEHSVGAIANGNIESGRSLARIATSIRDISRHKGLPLNRGRRKD